MTELLWGARFFRHLVHVGHGSTSAVHEALRLLVDLTNAAVAFVEIRGDRTFQRGVVRDVAGDDRYIADRAELPFACASQIQDALYAHAIETDDWILVRGIEAEVPVVGAVLLAKAHSAGSEIATIDRELVALFAEALATPAQQLARGRISLPEELDQLARRRISEALASNDGNVSAAARDLAVTRKYVESRLPKPNVRRVKRTTTLLPKDANQ